MKKLLLVLALGAVLTGCNTGERLDRRHPIQSGTSAYKMAVSPTKYSIEQLESFIIYMDTYASVKSENNSKWYDSEDYYHWSNAKKVFVITLNNRKEGR